MLKTYSSRPSAAERLAAAPHTKTFDINGVERTYTFTEADRHNGVERTYTFTEADRHSIVREQIAREEDELRARRGAAEPWFHLDIPQRMARVIERRRFLIGETVSLVDFNEEPETCDLSDAELRANIGKAKRLIDAATAEPTYDRATRLRQAAGALLPVLPQGQELRDTLALHHFTTAEQAELLPDLLSQVAAAWIARCKADLDMAGLDARGRSMLEENAE